MCGTCGCSRPEVEIDFQPEPAVSSEHYVGEDKREPTGSEMGSHAHFNGREDVRVLKLEADILRENRKYAQQNRRYLRQYARRFKPSIEVIRTSAKTGNGMRHWCDWLLG